MPTGERTAPGGEAGVGRAAWPAQPGQHVVFLAESASDVERRVLENWISRNRPQDTPAQNVEVIHLPNQGRNELRAIDHRLEARLRHGDDPLLAPVRVVWLPPEREGDTSVRLLDLVRFGNPRQPSARRQEAIVRREPDRYRVVAAEPALRSELFERWQRVSADEATNRAAFTRFVVRQAVLALERAEYRLLGAQYKVPRLVREEIQASARFRRGISTLARDLDRDAESVAEEANSYLDEMVTGYSRLFIDFTVHYGRWLQRLAYDDIDYDETQIERLREAVRGKPLIVLPTHRSNFDAAIMPVALHDNDLPRTHVLGGINMAFWPIGPIYRRLGTIFIRRDIKGNPVYRFVLREYVGFLMEKRFGLQWYLEGTRSRTGKMLPPKLGLLTYVTDAYGEGRVEDVVLVPASIAYDQLQEVTDYAAEAKGRSKRKEGLAWMLGGLTKQQRGNGKIYIRFGEPVSLRSALGAHEEFEKLDAAARRLELQKLAFEISWRNNHVTPVTGAALVTLTLLGTRDRALTFPQVTDAIAPWITYAREHQLPLAGTATALATPEGLRKALDLLAENGVVRKFTEGPETVYSIEHNRHVAASFYRNSIIHFFLTSAIAQTALMAARGASPREKPLEVFDAWTLRLRDLLKFDFFFQEKDEFRQAVAAEMEHVDPNWREVVAEGPGGIDKLLDNFDPLTAHTTLRPFFEAYRVVADALVLRGGGAPPEEKQFLTAIENLGTQYLLQRRIHNPESVSRLLFKAGLDLARNQKLLEEDAEEAALRERRATFAAEIATVLRLVGQVESLGLRKFEELMEQRRTMS